MDELILKYTHDKTGRSPDHFKQSEYHVLEPAIDARMLVLDEGAFYGDSVSITDKRDGSTLAYGEQYHFAFYVEEASIQAGQEVYAGIIVTDGGVSDEVFVDYQVVGGAFSNVNSYVIERLNLLINDGRPVDWTNLINIPDVFPPADHLHVIGDIYGWEYVVAGINRLTEAVMYGDEQSLGEIRQLVLDLVKEIEQTVQFNREERYAFQNRTDNPHNVTKAQTGLGLVQNFSVASEDEAMDDQNKTEYLTPYLVHLIVQNVAIAALDEHKGDNGDHDDEYIKRRGDKVNALIEFSHTLTISGAFKIKTINNGVSYGAQLVDGDYFNKKPYVGIDVGEIRYFTYYESNTSKRLFGSQYGFGYEVYSFGSHAHYQEITMDNGIKVYRHSVYPTDTDWPTTKTFDNKDTKWRIALNNTSKLNANNIGHGVVPNAHLPTTAVRWPQYTEITNRPGRPSLSDIAEQWPASKESEVREFSTSDIRNIVNYERRVTADHGVKRVSITVGGNANVYYPVVINPLNDNGVFKQNLYIYRGYSESAPSTWYTSTHRGSVALHLTWSGDPQWGGNNKVISIEDYAETYTYLQDRNGLIGGLELLRVGLVVWLRGGGAIYHMLTDGLFNSNGGPFRNASWSGSGVVGLNNGGFVLDTSSTSAHEIGNSLEAGGTSRPSPWYSGTYIIRYLEQRDRNQAYSNFVTVLERNSRWRDNNLRASGHWHTLGHRGRSSTQVHVQSQSESLLSVMGGSASLLLGLTPPEYASSPAGRSNDLMLYVDSTNRGLYSPIAGKSLVGQPLLTFDSGRNTRIYGTLALEPGKRISVDHISDSNGGDIGIFAGEIDQNIDIRTEVDDPHTDSTKKGAPDLVLHRHRERVLLGGENGVQIFSHSANMRMDSYPRDRYWQTTLINSQGNASFANNVNVEGYLTGWVAEFDRGVQVNTAKRSSSSWAGIFSLSYRTGLNIGANNDSSAYPVFTVATNSSFVSGMSVVPNSNNQPTYKLFKTTSSNNTDIEWEYSFSSNFSSIGKTFEIKTAIIGSPTKSMAVDEAIHFYKDVNVYNSSKRLTFWQNSNGGGTHTFLHNGRLESSSSLSVTAASTVNVFSALYSNVSLGTNVFIQSENGSCTMQRSNSYRVYVSDATAYLAWAESKQGVTLDNAGVHLKNFSNKFVFSGQSGGTYLYGPGGVTSLKLSNALSEHYNETWFKRKVVIQNGNQLNFDGVGTGASFLSIDYNQLEFRKEIPYDPKYNHHVKLDHSGLALNAHGIISWAADTDGAQIFYRHDDGDTGNNTDGLVFHVSDNGNENFIWESRDGSTKPKIAMALSLTRGLVLLDDLKGTAADWVLSSDKRLKKNIHKPLIDLQWFLDIPFKDYVWKEGDQHIETGVIAQELLSDNRYKQFVSVPDNDDDKMHVSYIKLITKSLAMLQPTIKTLVDDNQQLTNKVEQLENELNDIKARLSQLGV